MNTFLTAWNFLTIIRINTKQNENFAKSFIMFPIVGLILGILLIGINYGLNLVNFPHFSISAIILIFLIILTGGIHLDGFADTIDGLYGGRNKEEIIKIMEDPHIGSIGAISIFCVLLLKFSLLLGVKEKFFNQTLLIFPVIGRYAMVILGTTLPYAKENGIGKSFVTNEKSALILSSLFVLIVLVANKFIWGMFIFILVLIFNYFIGFFIKRKLYGITGDVFGFTCEINEVFTLLLMNIF
jgi:adenosylcobinamide-GDP ribazoletransferase